jgi:hypothetical protein
MTPLDIDALELVLPRTQCDASWETIGRLIAIVRAADAMRSEFHVGEKYDSGAFEMSATSQLIDATLAFDRVRGGGEA